MLECGKQKMTKMYLSQILASTFTRNLAIHTGNVVKKAEDNFQMSLKPQNNGIMRVNVVNSFLPEQKTKNDIREHVCKFAQFLKKRKKKTKTII